MNKNLIKALEEQGFEFKNITMTSGKNGVMVDTNYDGPYPPKETYEKIKDIENIVKRYKQYKTQTRGFYTAVLVVKV